VERTADIELMSWRAGLPAQRGQMRARVFVAALLTCALVSAGLASLVPLQFSIVTVFLFAGPHNWFELRYFLMRLPARFGKSRRFFVVAFAGISALTLAYVALPALYYVGLWDGGNWESVTGVWNTLLVLWIATLITLRAKQNTRRSGGWVWPAAFALCSLNWLAPQAFSLGLVYLHPLVALWFLDRHLRRTRPEWLKPYRRSLTVLPVLIFTICWLLAGTPALADDNGLAWRITQHAGTGILPSVSSHLLVSLHVFLEMLHYGVWLIALPLIGARGVPWDLKTIPLFRHPRGFPHAVTAVLIIAAGLMVVLWFGFVVDYSATRDIYFAVAMAHVLAEAPFLLRSL